MASSTRLALAEINDQEKRKESPRSGSPVSDVSLSDSPRFQELMHPQSLVEGKVEEAEAEKGRKRSESNIERKRLSFEKVRQRSESNAETKRSLERGNSVKKKSGSGNFHFMVSPRRNSEPAATPANSPTGSPRKQ